MDVRTFFHPGSTRRTHDNRAEGEHTCRENLERHADIRTRQQLEMKHLIHPILLDETNETGIKKPGRYSWNGLQTDGDGMAGPLRVGLPPLSPLVTPPKSI